jgi:hypothetical protein
MVMCVNDIKGSFGIVSSPVDEVHPQTASYCSLPLKDVTAKFFVQEYVPLVTVRGNSVRRSSSLYSLLESIVRPIQNVTDRVIRER